MLKITNTGKLIRQDWKPKTRTFKEVDVTPKLVSYLMDAVEFEEGTTLGHIYGFLSNKTTRTVLDVIFRNCFLEEFYQHIKKIPKGYTPKVTNGEEVMEHVELSFWGETGTYKPEGIVLEGFMHTPQIIGKAVGSDLAWGLSYTPIEDLLHLPLKIKNGLTIFSTNKPYTKVEYPKPLMRLVDLLYGIYEELSFCGSPSTTKHIQEKIDEILKVNLV